MQTSFSVLWSDSVNFIQNTLSRTLILLLGLTAVHSLLFWFISSDLLVLNQFIQKITASLPTTQPSIEALQHKLTQLPQQEIQTITYSATKILIILLVKVLISISAVFAFIHCVSTQSLTLQHLMVQGITLMSKLLLAFLILIPVLFLVYSLGSILGVIGISIITVGFSIAFCLLPALFVQAQQPTLSSLGLSYRAGFANVKLLLPITLGYLMISEILIASLQSVLISEVTNFLQLGTFFLFALLCYRLASIILNTTSIPESV